MRVIGLDLGTTNSRCAAWVNGGPVMIAGPIPSCVAFTDAGQLLVGDAALDRANAVSGVKRFLGKKFSDPGTRRDAERAMFEVRSDEEGGCVIMVDCGGGERRRFSPEELCAMVIRELKAAAELYLGELVTDAVISVPAHFGDAQRRAAKNAGAIAGLNVLRVIGDTASAVMAFPDADGVVLALDWGGGTLDATIGSVDNQYLQVKTTAGDSHLGGDDFDDLLVAHFALEFYKKRGVDVLVDSRAVSRLRAACEKTKRTLSTARQATVDVTDLGGGYDFHSNITRARFEEIGAELFGRCVSTVERAMREANVDAGSVCGAVFSGGATRIPKIREIIGELLGGREPRELANAVALGAAVQAELMIRDDFLLGQSPREVAPLSIGIETFGGAMSVMIAMNTRIPVRHEETFSTFADNQPGVLVQVFEGERIMAADNNLLGEFELSGISPAPRGVPKINIVFEVDESGILGVSATEESTGKRSDIQISSNRLSEREIKLRIADAELFRAVDADAKRKATDRVALDNYANNLKTSLTGDANCDMSCNDKAEAKAAVDSVLARMDASPDSDSIEEHRHALKAQIDEIITRTFFTTACKASMCELNCQPL